MIYEAIAVLFYGIGDLVTTKYIVSKPEGSEGNPIMGPILERFGFNSLILIKAIVIGSVWLAAPRDMWVLAYMGIIVVVWNTIQIIRYKHYINTEK